MKTSETRRDFMRQSIGAAAALGGAGVCLCGLTGCAAKTPQVARKSLERSGDTLKFSLADAPQLAPLGGSVIVKESGLPGPLIVVHVGEDEYRAFSAKCTHFGMPLAYDRDSGQLRCGSIGHSTFDLEGNVTKGPAKTPIKRYPVTVESQKLRIAT